MVAVPPEVVGPVIVIAVAGSIVPVVAKSKSEVVDEKSSHTLFAVV